MQVFQLSQYYRNSQNGCNSHPYQISFHNIRELIGRSTEGKQPQMCLESSNHFQIPPGELLICFPWLDENNHWTEILPHKSPNFLFWRCVDLVFCALTIWKCLAQITCTPIWWKVPWSQRFFLKNFLCKRGSKLWSGKSHFHADNTVRIWPLGVDWLIFLQTCK